MLRKEICPFYSCNSTGKRGIVTKFADFVFCPACPCLFLSLIMINNINNFGTINFYENNNSPSKKEQPQQVQDIRPIEEPKPLTSIIFTKKAKREAKETEILDALLKSIQGRRDKTRAFVDELHSWQKEGYIDAHFNAQVMYDELDKLTPLPFGYDAFKRLYNYTRV